MMMTKKYGYLNAPAMIHHSAEFHASFSLLFFSTSGFDRFHFPELFYRVETINTIRNSSSNCITLQHYIKTPDITITLLLPFLLLFFLLRSAYIICALWQKVERFHRFVEEKVHVITLIK